MFRVTAAAMRSVTAAAGSVKVGTVSGGVAEVGDALTGRA
jgi:hypothetical protein